MDKANGDDDDVSEYDRLSKEKGRDNISGIEYAQILIRLPCANIIDWLSALIRHGDSRTNLKEEEDNDMRWEEARDN